VTEIAVLLDPSRLMVAGSIVGTERTIDEIAEHTRLDRAVVLHSIGALRQAGLVTTVGDTYALPVTTLRELARAVSDTGRPMDPIVGDEMTDDERVVLSRFFAGRALTKIPVDRSKRLIVLERLALEFDVGRRYDEPTVNGILHGFHPDVAALRRYLVDEHLLDRSNRQDGHPEYWRSGGRVPSTG